MADAVTYLRAYPGGGAKTGGAMARVAILDAFEELAQLLAEPLRGSQHEVLVEVIPVDFERLIRFGPDVIVAVLYRMNKAFDRAIEQAELDILGYIPLLSLKRYSALRAVPLLLVGYGLHERDIPNDCCDYEAFLSLPKDVRLFSRKAEELANRPRATRKISAYLCPHCGSRLTYAPRKPEDLFCPRCGTSVAIIDEEHCIYSPAGTKGPGRPCSLGQLMPKPPEAAAEPSPSPEPSSEARGS